MLKYYLNRRQVLIYILLILIASLIAYNHDNGNKKTSINKEKKIDTNNKSNTFENDNISYQPQYNKVSILFNKNINELNELSDIAASKNNNGIFWAHNDSKSSPAMLAFDKIGNIVNRIDLSTLDSIEDTEDMCLGSFNNKEYLFVGDVGDNKKKRDEYSIIMIEEPLCGQDPNLASAPSNPLTYKFKYSDNEPHDCESIAFNPNGSIYLLTKKDKPKLFKLDLKKLSTDKVNEAKYIGKFELKGLEYPSAIDINRDGSKMVVRNERTIYLFENSNSGNFDEILKQKFTSILCPPEPNGEAISFDPNDSSIYTASELQPKILYKLE